MVASKTFQSTYGLDPDYGLSETTLQEVETDRALINAAATLIVVADLSKFSQKGTIRLVPTERINTLVTDLGAEQVNVDTIERQGVRVTVV